MKQKRLENRFRLNAIFFFSPLSPHHISAVGFFFLFSYFFTKIKDVRRDWVTRTKCELASESCRLLGHRGRELRRRGELEEIVGGEMRKCDDGEWKRGLRWSTSSAKSNFENGRVGGAKGSNRKLSYFRGFRFSDSEYRFSLMNSFPQFSR